MAVLITVKGYSLGSAKEKDAEGNSSSEAKNGAYTMEIYKPGYRNNPIYNSDLIYIMFSSD